MVDITKKEALVLAQKVIGVANMGFLASDRIVKQARETMEQLTATGECVAPEAVRALSTLQMRALPGQNLCRAAMEQINQTLRPIQQQVRAERASARQQHGDSDSIIARERQMGG